MVKRGKMRNQTRDIDYNNEKNFKTIRKQTIITILARR